MKYDTSKAQVRKFTRDVMIENVADAIVSAETAAEAGNGYKFSTKTIEALRGMFDIIKMMDAREEKKPFGNLFEK